MDCGADLNERIMIHRKEPRVWNKKPKETATQMAEMKNFKQNRLGSKPTPRNCGKSFKNSNDWLNLIQNLKQIINEYGSPSLSCTNAS